MSFKQHDKREVIGSKVNGFTSARTIGDLAFAAPYVSFAMSVK
jgi:hypothetical protein